MPCHYIVVLYANDFKKCKLPRVYGFQCHFVFTFYSLHNKYGCTFSDQNLKETLRKKNAGEDGARALRKKCVMHIHKRTSASNATWHITSSEFYLSATIPQWGFKDY